MSRLRLGLAAALLSAAPAGLHAQECTVLDNQSVNVTNRGTPQEIYNVVGADIACPGGRRIFADYATIHAATGTVDLRGNVRFSDPERALASETAQYDRINQRLYARGNVRVRALASNSTLTSEALTYVQAIPGREAHMLAHPGARRPQAVIRRVQTGMRTESPRPDSTVVDADLIEAFGERLFHAAGNAVLTRDSLRASGGVIDYVTATGSLTVAGAAVVEGPRYRLLGDTVRAEVTADTLRAVHARRDARLITDELEVVAPVIDIALSAGQVERMIAVLLPDQRDGGPLQARVSARSFRLAADSIEVRAPAQQLEEVVAVGRSFGEMLDTLPPLPLPEEAAQGLANDWMRGDTLHAYFVANPRAQTDSTAEARILERLVAGGAPAAALYRKRAPAAEGAEGAPEIGYVLANVIEVRLADGEVSDVKAEGEVRGMYLQPRAGPAVVGGPAPAAPAGEPAP